MTWTRKLRMEEPIYVSSKLATSRTQDVHIDFYKFMKKIRTQILNCQDEV